MGLLNFLLPISTGISDWLNGNSGSGNNPLSGENGIFSNPVGAWDKFKNGATNDVNERIANQNLDYQRERNAIEDERYIEERDYNRAFAEEQRDYNRALQQQLFEREDTAIERQASSLSSMGINPLSQQLNGLGAGQAVSAPTPPSDSLRGGTALHNDFQMQDKGIMQALEPLASLANTINQVATGQGQRDLIRSQVDKQNLDNFITAYENGIFDWNNKNFKYYQGQATGSGLFNRKNEESNMNLRLGWNDLENKYKPEWARNMNYLVSDDFFQAAEKALTKGSDLFEKSMNKVFDNDKDKLKFNPFKSFLELFY